MKHILIIILLFTSFVNVSSQYSDEYYRQRNYSQPIYNTTLKESMKLRTKEDRPKITIKQYLNDNKYVLISLYLAGAASGHMDVLQNHYNSKFKKLFPNANDNYWNPERSWKNKYKYCDPKQGEKHFGSKTFLVWTTDGYHATKMIHKMFIFTAISFSVNDFKGKRFIHHIRDIFVYGVVYTAGFYTTYDCIYRF